MLPRRIKWGLQKFHECPFLHAAYASSAASGDEEISMMLTLTMWRPLDSMNVMCCMLLMLIVPTKWRRQKVHKCHVFYAADTHQVVPAEELYTADAAIRAKWDHTDVDAAHPY